MSDVCVFVTALKVTNTAYMCVCIHEYEEVCHVNVVKSQGNKAHPEQASEVSGLMC